MAKARWRVVICDGLAEEGQALLRAEAELIEGASAEALRTAEALIVRSRTRVDAALLAGAPRLKVIGRAGAGVDSIDLPAARAAGVIVVNAPEAVTAAAAEHALALMLALARQIPRADAALRRGEWIKAELMGRELGGRTLGLVGFGRIGRAVAARAGALGMRVLAHSRSLDEATARAHGAQRAPLEHLLGEADIVSLHVPLDEGTRGLIDRRALARMKPGALLISTARGGVVDEAALLEALEQGRLDGAALDVFAHEPPGRSPLLEQPAVIATPHLAAQTAEAQRRAAIDIATEILAALRGDPLRWRVA